MREMQAESPRLREEVLSAQGLQESVKKAEIAVFGAENILINKLYLKPIKTAQNG